MSAENVISIENPGGDVHTVKEALAIIQTSLAPYLLALTPELRKTIPKMSDGTEPFVSKVMDYVVSNPQFAPPYMDVPKMKLDFRAVSELMPLLRTFDQIQSNLNDTAMMASFEAYVAALSYYNSVKMAARMNVPEAQVIYDDLSKRFEGHGLKLPYPKKTE